MDEIKADDIHFHFSNAFESFLKQALIYCSAEEKVQGFCRSGIPYVFSKWMRVKEAERLLSMIKEYKASDVQEARVHPNSNGQMIDVVHPCWHAQWSSTRWIWIPSDFAQGRFVSYINNLHTSCKNLYTFIEQLVDQALPLLNKCIQAARMNAETTLPFAEDFSFGSSWIPAARAYRKFRKYLDSHCAFDDTENLEELRCYPIWPNDCSFGVQEPSLAAEEVPSVPKQEQEQNHLAQEENLQFYVKIATIQLLPGSASSYEGGWHVEGVPDEHIMATAIYYFETENVTDSFIEFRVPTTDAPYEQSDDMGVQTLFGLNRSNPAEQTLGRVATKPHRLLCFPNSLQHRVSSFQLIDPTKIGRRSFVVLWLVDPRVQLKSTASIAPTQISWILREIKQVVSSLGSDVCSLIATYTSPWTINNLIESVESMFHDRKQVYKNLDESTMLRELNLCEH